MTSSASQSIPKHTPGPWRWEICLRQKQLRLCGGVPSYDLNVLDFVRWGMSGAAPRFNKLMDGNGRLMLMHRAEEFASVVEGREHHADWFQSIDHPDARLIAAAPDLLAALKAILASARGDEKGESWTIRKFLDDRDIFNDDIQGHERLIEEAAKWAIAKAEGR